MKEIETLQDLLEFLKTCTPEQLSNPVQAVAGHPVDEYVHIGQQAVCIGTINELGIRYFRSAKDNRRNGEELVIYTDGNPFSENGSSAHTFDEENNRVNIFPENHDPSCDWTGPAQKIADSNYEFKKDKNKSTAAILNKRKRTKKC